MLISLLVFSVKGEWFFKKIVPGVFDKYKVLIMWLSCKVLKLITVEMNVMPDIEVENLQQEQRFLFPHKYPEWCLESSNTFEFQISVVSI